MSIKRAILEIIGQLFNKTVSITRDGFVVINGIVQLVNGEEQKIKTVYLTGTTATAATTLIPHGIIDAEHILEVSADLYNASSLCWCVEEYKLTPTTSNGYAVMYDDINIMLEDVGVSFRGQGYKIKITYIVD